MRGHGTFLIGGIHTDGRSFAVILGELRDGALCYLGTAEYGVRGEPLGDLLSRAQPFVRDSSPFADLRRRAGVVWLEPVLVAEIAYHDIMQGRLQAAVFQGLMPSPHR